MRYMSQEVCWITLIIIVANFTLEYATFDIDGAAIEQTSLLGNWVMQEPAVNLRIPYGNF